MKVVPTRCACMLALESRLFFWFTCTSQSRFDVSDHRKCGKLQAFFKGSKSRVCFFIEKIVTFCEIYMQESLLKNMKACCQALGHSTAVDNNSSFLTFGLLRDARSTFAWRREVARVSIATSLLTLHRVCIAIR